MKLTAARKLIPFLRLVEREKLRVPEKTKKAYTQFFESNETKNLFDKIVLDKLAISQILLLLKKESLSTSDIADNLGLNPSDVSRHINTSSRQGLIQYDTNSNCYALA
jgi:F420-non-reducing hydrogenase iron-sulfur subunit